MCLLLFDIMWKINCPFLFIILFFFIVPKKVMWNTALVAETLRQAPSYGFELDSQPAFNWSFLKGKRDAYIKRLNGIYDRNLGNDNVEHLHGWASFVGPNTVRVQRSETESYEVQAKNILIATGKEKSG